MTSTTSPTAPSPLQILHHLRDLHPAADVAGLIPHIVPRRERIKRGHDALPPWLLWVWKDAGSPVKGRIRGVLSPLERDVERAVRGCVEEGVWEMLWEEVEEDESQEESQEDDDEEEEEEEETAAKRRRLRPGAWDVLDFLVALWTQDESGQALFLQQLKKPYADRLADDASAALSIVRAAFGLAKAAPPATSMADTIRQRRIATELVHLLFAAASSPPSFLPSALRSAMLQLMRHAPADKLRLFLSAVDRAHWREMAHVLSHAVEDVAGVRNLPGREKVRRFAPGELGAPEVGYALDLALLPPASPDGDARIAVLKAALLMTLLTHAGDSPAWAKVKHDGFVDTAARGDVALTAVLRLAARKAA